MSKSYVKHNVVNRPTAAAAAPIESEQERKWGFMLAAFALASLFAVATLADGHAKGEQSCQGFGPQTPRDIDQLSGTNKRSFSLAPDYSEMNLCNIHFHANAEHKAKDFAIYAGKGDKKGVGGGYQCAISQSLSKAELKPVSKSVCGGIEPGDTVEFHWVHSSCDVSPGPTLGACLSDSCANPDLRVETQVFTVVNDKDAMDFDDFRYAGAKEGSLHQVKALPTNTGQAVEFAGSTTGPSFNAQQCSPLQVSWSVRPHCAKVSIQSLAKWCESNDFDEDHAHGVRELVTDPSLLSEIK
ncbi:MAG: delta-class carbonic anhydrase [Pseudomonadales bacterium]